MENMSKIITNLVEAHIFRETEKGLQFLLLRRAETEIYPGLWQMVSGKIDEGEKAFEAALREIREETNLVPKRFWTAPNINSFYYPEGDYISMLPVFAALVEKDSKVQISHEHTEYKWLNAEEAKKLLAWQGQRNSVDIISEYFLKEISSLNFVEIQIK